jgi:hypothetical protein
MLNNNTTNLTFNTNQDSLVAIATVYGLDGRSSIPGRDSFLLHNVQTNSGVHPGFFSMGTGGLYPCGVMLTTHHNLVLGSRFLELYPYSPISLHGVVVNN